MSAKVSATKVCPGCSKRYPADALFCPNDGTPLTLDAVDAGPGPERVSDSYLGREISGHIEIKELAGVGAMGKVYRAFQRGIDRDVAVKVLHRELSANQQLVTRFHREARVASRLSHPNVVQVHLAGQLPDGAMYIVMEYLDGVSLQSALASEKGPFELSRALHIALQICDAAGEAHSQGVVHRDLKPENVMLVRRGDDLEFVKVLDFGIARLNWGEQSMATAAGLIFGTARYISPEGAQGEAVGPAGDVYAIATLLYQMLAGRTPFEGDQAVALLVQQIHDTPPELRSLPAAKGVPASIAEVVMKNLAKTPADRASDARAFGRALVDAAKSVGLHAEELVHRSSLFAPPRPSEPVPGRDSATPQPTVRDARPSQAGLISVTTQKWVAPQELSGEPSRPPPTTVPDAAPKARVGRSVDPTLDDEPPPQPAAAPAHVPIRTQLAAPLPVLPLPPPDALGVTQAASPPFGGSPKPPQADFQTRPTQRSMGQVDPGPPRVSPHPVHAAASLAEALEDPPEEARRKRSRFAGVTLAFFLLGIVIACVVSYRLGLFGPAPEGSLEESVSRADDALRHARWDAPPGDNVKDLTTAGLAKWPHEPRLMDIRSRATDELVKEAVGRKFSGDLPGALHWAHLAKELDPTDTTAQRLVQEYEQASARATPSASVSTGPVPTPTHAPPGHAATPAGPVKIVIDSLAPHPKVGQPLTFVARVAPGAPPPKSIDDVRFVINGPGLASDTKLAALPLAPGAYQTTFTGFEPGKYDVAFEGRVDGAMVRGTRTLSIEGGAQPPPPPSAPPATGPSTNPHSPAVPSGKWL